MSYSHVPVLIEETLRVLSPQPGEVYADATAGLGGHAAKIAELMGRGVVILNDSDGSNLERAAARVQEVAPGVRVESVRGNFAGLPREVESRGLRVDMLLADLGFASTQVDDAARGFSFMHDGPLDMRMDQGQATTAADLVASLSERDLAKMIAEYGEDRAAGRIARKLVQERRRGPIRTTAHLADIVRSAAGGGSGGIDPATRTFQALRIAVNDEIGSLGALLASIEADGMKVLSGGQGRFLGIGSRVALITFHSLEDRPVKQAFARLVKAGAADLTDGHQSAGEAELASNPRSRSAKLRALGFGKRAKIT